VEAAGLPCEALAWRLLSPFDGSRALGTMVLGKVLYRYPHRFIGPTDSTTLHAQACGRSLKRGAWEGWIEFVSEDDSLALCTPRETEQASLIALDYWASGLTRVHLERALLRSQRAPPPRVSRGKGIDRSVFQEPASEELDAIDEDASSQHSRSGAA
jgi:hypothetical protein